MIERISAITLATHDMARAVRFYRALGLEVAYGGEASPWCMGRRAAPSIVVMSTAASLSSRISWSVGMVFGDRTRDARRFRTTTAWSRCG